MTVEEAKRIVLAKYPTAWVYRPRPNYPIGITGDHSWTIMKAVGCVPDIQNALGSTSVTTENAAWVFAAQQIELGNTPIDEPLPSQAKAIVNSGYNHTKHNNACLLKAGDDEPIFVIRAQDASAAGIIQMWLITNPHISPEKRAEAIDCQRAMREWPKKKKAD